MDSCQNGSSRSTDDDAACIAAESDEQEFDFLKLDKPRPMVEKSLLWLLTAASVKTGRPHIAREAIEIAETRLMKDNWPEYYDGKLGRYIGKQARKCQTWSIAGYLVSKMMLEDPSLLSLVSVSLEENKNQKPVLRRSNSCPW